MTRLLCGAPVSRAGHTCGAGVLARFNVLTDTTAGLPLRPNRGPAGLEHAERGIVRRSGRFILGYDAPALRRPGEPRWPYLWGWGFGSVQCTDRHHRRIAAATESRASGARACGTRNRE